ncbi:MAG: ABC transporter ATP-binding protein, partial [Anaerolineae bacterium]|nr:ABC transporter ATP-binding protein [Anaerolineae bacterium]
MESRHSAVERPTEVILRAEDLSVEYAVRRGVVRAVRRVSFELRRGEALALIGESGSGKTTLGLALVGLLPRTARVPQGHVIYRRQNGLYDVLSLSAGELRRFRWQECAIVFQSALNALNPVLRVADQFYDTARAHGSSDRAATRRRAHELLRLVQLDPGRVWRAYPHELSGGMRQRVLIALGLLLEPQVIILDEPTTALDILTQRAVIDVLRQLRQKLDFSLICISHDLSLAAELADRVATMYAGAIVE